MLCQFIDDTVADGFLFSVFGSIVNILEGASNVNRLAFSRATDILAPRFDFFRPIIRAFPAKIAFYDIVSTIFKQNTDVFGCVVTGIKPHQLRLLCDVFAELYRLA